MTWAYLGIQAIGLLGTGCYLVSYQFKDNRRLFMMQTLCYVFYTLHYFLLGAITGAGSYMINLMRSYFLFRKGKASHSWWVCAVLCVLQVVVAATTWAGWISILPCVANIASTIGAYTYNPQKIRASNMFINSPLCIIYAVLVGSWAGIIDETVGEASMIISVVRFGWKGLDEKQD